MIDTDERASPVRSQSLQNNSISAAVSERLEYPRKKKSSLHSMMVANIQTVVRYKMKSALELMLEIKNENISVRKSSTSEVNS